MNVTRAAKALSAAGLILIATWEGYEAMPYKDIGGVWTDGFGNTHKVVPGKPVTVPKALARLQKNTSETGLALNDCIKVTLNQNQYDAFLSLAFNVGVKAVCESTTMDILNDGHHNEACLRIMLYNKVRIGGKLVPSKGLTARRQAERDLCLTPES